ncbi:hypothetical protein E3N88_01146 [Mikania micrantha]|uniref:Long-chain-alcohol oxidase n=1 Tax=Mikania micrantha TaxID=192012 RepID=A0A5N6Q2W5_9ASTR|nr:hypothetical protein E3N88_01146 [Mikania micrantha]
MESLTSICEVILQPLPSNSLNADHTNKTQESIQLFSNLSASDHSIPNKVVHLLLSRAFFEAVMVVRLVLKLLSTRLGTLFVAGSLCFTGKWPYVNKFSEICLHKREKIVQKWLKHSFLTPVRLGFVFIKSLCLLVSFSQVNEKLKNPTWEAIGYHVETDEKHPKEQKERPLQKGMVETMNETDQTLVNSLMQKGLDVTENLKENICKINCDVVIIGSGCGGGVAAAILAKSGKKVVVLEKGNYFNRSDYSKLEGPSLDQLYESGGVLPTLDGKVMIQAGSTVGGCKAEKLLFTKNHQEKRRRKKCLGVISQVLNQKITKRLQIEAKVTISACGSLLTPPLLISSGLKNPNIGKHLHLHPVLMAWGYFPENDSNLAGKNYKGGILTSVYKPGLDDDYILEVPGLGPGSFAALYWNIYGSAHQMGSCRMGASEHEGAVDENGESWEAEGLYVCDASILPSAVGVNPMITIQSTVYCLAQRIANMF